MSREIRRVPIGFDWPLRKTWEGYRNPFYKHRKDCSGCKGTGYSPQAKLFGDQWYGNAPFDPAAYGAKPLMVDDPNVIAFAARNVRREPGFCLRGRSVEDAIKAEAARLHEHWKNQWGHHLIQADVDALITEGRLYDFTHRFEQGTGWVAIEPQPVVTPEMVNAWSIRGMGHDAINQWVCVKARCEREGFAHTCEQCGGDGSAWPSKAHEALYEAWKNIEPPTGDGYQVWETVSEGSPITPAFETPEALADWCVANLDGLDTASREQWLKFIGVGWAPSMTIVGGVMSSNASTL